MPTQSRGHGTRARRGGSSLRLCKAMRVKLVRGAMPTALRGHDECPKCLGAHALLHRSCPRKAVGMAPARGEEALRFGFARQCGLSWCGVPCPRLCVGMMSARSAWALMPCYTDHAHAKPWAWHPRAARRLFASALQGNAG